MLEQASHEHVKTLEIAILLTMHTSSAINNSSHCSIIASVSAGVSVSTCFLVRGFMKVPRADDDGDMGSPLHQALPCTELQR